MFSDRVYQIAFLVSLIAHGFIFLKSAGVNMAPQIKKQQEVKISYVKTPVLPSQSAKPKLLAREPFSKLPSQVTIDKRTPPPFVDKEGALSRISRNILSDSSFAKPAPIKTDVIAIKKKITLPPIDVDKINNPSYIGYYQIVREKIRRCAYQNYARTETGETYLTFIIAGDGSLREVRLVEQKSSSSEYLKEIALRSIKEASPFPAFPKELDYPQLSFNVVISFEIDK